MKTKLLAAFLAIVMVFAMTSCAVSPTLDFDKAKKNLEDRDYDVDIEDDEDYLDVGVVEQLEAYSDDYDDYIYIVKYESAKYAKIAYKVAKQQFDAEVEAAELEIQQIEYILDNYENELDSDEIDEYEDELKELRKELEENKEDYVLGIKGDTLWFGTTKAAEDSK